MQLYCYLQEGLYITLSTLFAMHPSPIHTWLTALRLPTILLATSSVMMGSALAIQAHQWHPAISFLAWITASLLQLITNLANDYGDFERGANVDKRVSAAGTHGLTLTQIRRTLVLLVVLAIVFGLILLGVAKYMAHLPTPCSLRFLFLGGLSIVAAIAYTMGTKPYAYMGLGDVSVFFFFGIVGVAGTAYLHQPVLYADYALPMIASGCFAVAVLNVNNIRDIASDKQVAKNTLVVRLGRRFGICYQWSLLLSGMGALLLFTYWHYHSYWQWLYVVTFPLLIRNGILTMVRPAEKLTQVLQNLVLLIFCTTVLFTIGIALV